MKVLILLKFFKLNAQVLYFKYHLEQTTFLFNYPFIPSLLYLFSQFEDKLRIISHKQARLPDKKIYPDKYTFFFRSTY